MEQPTEGQTFITTWSSKQMLKHIGITTTERVGWKEKEQTRSGKDHPESLDFGHHSSSLVCEVG